MGRPNKDSVYVSSATILVPNTFEHEDLLTYGFCLHISLLLKLINVLIGL